MRHKKAALGAIMALDALLINVAFVLSYIVRYQLELPYPVDERYDAPFTPYIPFAILLTVLCLLTFGLNGLYARRRRFRWFNTVYNITTGTATSIATIMAITFFVQPLVYSRGMLVLASVLIVLFLSLVRLLQYASIANRRKRGINTERILIVGAGEVGRAVIRTILADPLLGYHVIGYLDDDPAKSNGLGRIKSLGETNRVAEAIRENDVSEVIITLPWMYHRKIMQIINRCEEAGVRVHVVPDVFQRSMRTVDLETLNGIPLMSPMPDQPPASVIFIKRILDLLLSLIALPFFGVIYVVVAILIKLDSPGPVIFKQKRIGKNGKPFQVLKFRTMIQGADNMKAQVAHLSKFKDDLLIKVPDDPRLTKIGGFLRRTSIDELPQIINVLRGEMSWIGPRPNTPDEVARYEPWHHKRLGMLPGITGLWQVSGRSNIPFDEMCLLDIFYIESWSLELDLRILLQTIPNVLFGNGAY